MTEDHQPVAPDKSRLTFWQGGGEMGALTRAVDWSGTTLGPPENWPLSLRTTLGIVLHSAFPMFLFWGRELTCFYNNAYRPSLGSTGKHPAVGQPGKAVWTETWDFTGPLIEQVMTTGEPVWFEDQLVPIHRNGRLEDVYWTFSYSPAFGDDGQINGVLVTCTETTAKVQTINQLQLSEQRFQNLVRDASVGIIVLSGEDMTVTIVNDGYARLIDRPCDELMGKPLFNLIPDAEAVFRPIIDSVRQTGEPLHLYSQPYLVRNADGAAITGFLDLVYQPYKEQDGTITGVVALCQDVTGQREAQDEKQKLTAILEVSHEFVGLTDVDGTVQYINPAGLAMLGWAGIDGKNMLDCVYPDDRPAAEALLPHLLNKGHFSEEIRFVNAQTGQFFWMQWNAFTIRDTASGEVTGLATVSPNITKRRRDEQALKESEERFQAAVKAVEGVLWTNNAIGQMEGEQPGWAALTGQTYDEYQGYGWANAVHPDDAQQSVDAWNEAVEGRRTFVFEHRVRLHDGSWGLFSIRAIPLLDASGFVREWVGVHTNITEQRRAGQALAESELFSRSIFDDSPVANIVFIGQDMVIRTVNENMLEMLGRDASIIGKPFMEALPELIPTPLMDRLRQVLTTGETYFQPAEKIDLMRYGKPYTGFYNYIYKALYNATGDAYGIICTATEVTEQVLARQKVEEAEAALRGAIDMAELGTWQIDLATRTLDYSARLRGWFGIGMDEVITPERAYRPVRANDRPRVQAAIAHATTPGTDGIYDIEYSLDPVEAGRERVLHIQGRALLNEKGIPYKLRGTAQDVTEQRRVQQELERLVTERTRQLKESNEDLLRSNGNLQQFAYIASHDLQEPLRKIQSFGDLLKAQYADRLGEGVDHLSRMQTAASRMSVLIKDLLSFSRVSTRQENTASVSLATVVETVLSNLEVVITETGAQVSVEPLPTVQGDATQLGQLFQNLLSNALKFRRADTAPVIRVSTGRIAATDLPGTVKPTRTAAAYQRIDVSDNGIGFDEKYADRIFQVFQRLHGKSEFAGTGIGLAICEKVAANHGGAIAAASRPGQGATFSVYLPA